jgi:hypothetical protein
MSRSSNLVRRDAARQRAGHHRNSEAETPTKKEKGAYGARDRLLLRFASTVPDSPPPASDLHRGKSEAASRRPDVSREGRTAAG